MVNTLERYGGWPVVKGDQWVPEDWNWLKTSIQIVNDGLIDLILACHIEVNPNNSSKHILVVRFSSPNVKMSSKPLKSLSDSYR